MSLLKVRTFLEHRAHEKPRARTVVIEGQGLWSFLFLNNNFHVVHHMHPTVSWYKLPRLYHGNRDHYLRRNQGYFLQVIPAFSLNTSLRPKIRSRTPSGREGECFVIYENCYIADLCVLRGKCIVQISVI